MLFVSGFSTPSRAATESNGIGRRLQYRSDYYVSRGDRCIGARLPFMPSDMVRRMDQKPIGSTTTRSSIPVRAAVESQSELSDDVSTRSLDSSISSSIPVNGSSSGSISAESQQQPASLNGRTAADVANVPFSSATTSSDDASSDSTDGADDVPQPTVNGGFSHTAASKAKISAANKGKTPWNKGKARSEEVRARIAAGVRAKNRERFLKKIADMGLTEEEYNARKKEEKRKREAERRARRTERGGYRPTEETKAKISAILKEKWANGEVKKRAASTGARKKGFKHSEETKQKIRDSLRKRWANDPEYRARKEASARIANQGADARKRIANTLKKKWQDPEFRAYMMAKMAKRKKPTKPVDASHREKISLAMKKKWQDASYREKAVGGMKKKFSENPRPRTAPKRKKATKTKQKALKNNTYSVMPESSAKPKKRVVRKTKLKTTGATATTKRKKTTSKKKMMVKTPTKGADAAPVIEAVKPITQPKKPLEDDADDSIEDGIVDGRVAQLRHERRDLYDLLYGDDDDAVGANEAALYDKQTAPAITKAAPPPKGRQNPAGRNAKKSAASPEKAKATIAAAAGIENDLREPVFSPSLPSFSFDNDDDDDDNLDNFDPYGLEDY